FFRSACLDRFEEDVVRDRALRTEGVHEARRQRSANGVDSVTAKAVDVEPLPSLVLVWRRKQFVDLATGLASGSSGRPALGAVNSIGLLLVVCRRTGIVGRARSGRGRVGEGEVVFGQQAGDRVPLAVEGSLNPRGEGLVRLSHAGDHAERKGGLGSFADV